MNMRFRLLLVFLGALIVAATYTFPVWQPFFLNQETVSRFPELPPELRDSFDLALTSSEQEAFLDLRRENPQQALEMVTSRLQDNVVVPPEQQSLPVSEGQIAVAVGDFNEITPIRKAEGTATIYERPDGSRFVWFSDFSVPWGPGLQVFLSTRTMLDMEEMDDDEELKVSADDILLGRIEANVGSQRYDIAPNVNLGLYDSIVIYSNELGLIYSMAELIK